MFSMAENLDDGEFWLPSKFLAEDDLESMESKCDFGKSLKGNTLDSLLGPAFDADVFSSAWFSTEFSPGFSEVSSVLGSPLESLVRSSETESDEEDRLAELTRKISHTFDANFDNTGFVYGCDKLKGKVSSGSPQSTLCPFGSECGCSHGSPTSACQVPSPRSTWDLLHAAAGEVERMRRKREAYRAHHGRGLLGHPGKPSAVTLPVKDNSDFIFHPNQSLSNQQIQVAKLQILKQQQMLRQQARQQRHVMMVGGGSNPGPMGLSSSALPSMQQAEQQSYQPKGSGMRALFLGNHGGKKECAGTGVFLPRTVDSPAEPRRKPACSTVLVPAKVVQALNLKLDDMVTAQSQYSSRFNGGLDSDVAIKLKLRNNNGSAQHMRKNLRPQQHQQRHLNHEFQLPQEWTY